MIDPHVPDAVTVGDKTFTLDFGCNMACKLEAATGQSYGDALAAIGRDPSATRVRQLIWAAMVDPAATLEDAGRCIDAMGGQAFLGSALQGQLAKPLEVEAVAP